MSFLAASLLAATSLPAAPQTASALVSTQPGAPLTAIQGQGGIETQRLEAGRFYLSESGERWAAVLIGRGLPTESDQFITSGTTAGVDVVQRESAPLPGLGLDLLEFNRGSIGVNDAGQLSLGAALNGSGQSSASASANLLFDAAAGGWTIVHRGGDSVPGLPGLRYSHAGNDHVLTADGTPVSLQGVERSGNHAVWLMVQSQVPSALVQTRRTVPIFPSGLVTLPLTGIQLARVSEDAQHNLIIAESREDGTASRHRFVAVDGSVVVELGEPFAGLTGNVDWPISSARMFAGGDWAIILRTTTADRAVVSNGAVVAKRYDPVPDGAPGEYMNFFRDVAMNRAGDLVYVAGTNSGRVVVILVPSAASGGAPFLALAGSSTDPTQGLQLDMDGDCQLDDAYLANTWTGTIGLSEARRVFLGGTFVGAQGQARGGALFSFPADSQSPLDCDGNGLSDGCQIAKNPVLDMNENGVLDSCEIAPVNVCLTTPNSAGVGALMGFSGSQTVSLNDFELSASPVPNGAGLFFYGQTEIPSGLPGGNGLVCIGGPTFRLPVEQASSNTLRHALDLTSVPAPLGQILPGSTWLFQAWFRDVAAGGAGYDFSDALEVLFY